MVCAPISNPSACSARTSSQLIQVARAPHSRSHGGCVRDPISSVAMKKHAGSPRSFSSRAATV